MTTTALRNEVDAYTSMTGSVSPFRSGTGMATMLDPVVLPESVTADDRSPFEEARGQDLGGSYGFSHPIESTVASSIKEIISMFEALDQTIAKDWHLTLKLKKHDNSTDILHHWLNASSSSTKDDQMLHEVLTLLLYPDRSNQDNTPSLFSIIDKATGVHMPEPSRHSGDIMDQDHVEGEQTPEPHRIPLSPAAWDMRRPQPQALLLEAELERPPLIPGKVRVVRPRRAPKRTD